jgi:hypothetical protein
MHIKRMASNKWGDRPDVDALVRRHDISRRVSVKFQGVPSAELARELNGDGDADLALGAGGTLGGGPDDSYASDRSGGTGEEAAGGGNEAAGPGAPHAGRTSLVISPSNLGKIPFVTQATMPAAQSPAGADAWEARRGPLASPAGGPADQPLVNLGASESVGGTSSDSVAAAAPARTIGPEAAPVMPAAAAHVPRPPSGPPAPGPDTPQRHNVRAPRGALAAGHSAAHAVAAAVAAVQAEAAESGEGQALPGAGDDSDKIRELQKVGVADSGSQDMPG